MLLLLTSLPHSPPRPAEFISMMPKWVTLTTEYILHGGSFAIKFCPLMDRDRTAGGGEGAGPGVLFCQPRSELDKNTIINQKQAAMFVIMMLFLSYL